MRFDIEGETLTMYLEGELNSYTSEEVEKEVEKIMSENTFNKVILDLEDVRYISSAGLRLIVRIKQQYDDTSLINTPPSVYEVFMMVGFEKMMTIQKRK